MSKVITLFNHKGGVSKTTTTFHLGWKIAKKGYKVLMVDGDPQCNLTGVTAKNFRDEDEGTLFYKENAFYDSKENEDIYSALKPILEGKVLAVDGIKPTETRLSNLDMIAGNIELAESEIPLTMALTTAGAGSYLPFAKQFIGALNAHIRETMSRKEYDVVLIDLSPSIGVLNGVFLMSSDYFIIPTSPDYFCLQAIDALSQVLPKWADQFKPFRDPDMPNRLPKENPKFLGIISQKYRRYKTSAKDTETTKAYQQWIDKIKARVNQKLVPSLREKNMVIDEPLFTQHVKEDTPYNLISIGDFNTLIPKSQKYGVPVFELSDQQLELTGNVKENSKEKQKEFDKKFTSLADSVLGLVGLPAQKA